MTLSSKKLGWLNSLSNSIPEYLIRLQVDGKIGHYKPVTSGLTEQGKQIRLGMSCYALKIYYMLGLWEQLATDQQSEWISYLQSFQQGWGNAFVDPVVLQYLSTHPKRGWTFKLRQGVTGFLRLRGKNHLEKTIHAETKQAIATLLEVEAKPKVPYRNFPKTPSQLAHHLETLDWALPWGAGAHTATIAVFLESQEKQNERVASLKQQLSDFIAGTVDEATGTYYIADKQPHYDNLINGAMKVLTALDWLDVPIHRPGQLVDTCLSQIPSNEGCHIVDVIYVLYRCLQQADYRREAIQDYCIQVLDMIHEHYVAEEGAFSYFTGKSQVSYYGVPVASGEAVADIHGTILLTWALSMIFDILDDDRLPAWKVIKP